MKIAAFILALFAAVASGYLGWQEYHRPPPEKIVVSVPLQTEGTVSRVIVPPSTQSDVRLMRLANLQLQALQQTMKEMEGRGFSIDFECAENFCYRGASIESGKHYRAKVTKTTELR